MESLLKQMVAALQGSDKAVKACEEDLAGVSMKLSRRARGGGNETCDATKRKDDNDDNNNDNASAEDDDDDPRQSAAALCLSVRFLGNNNDNDKVYYGPEFTHQCFEGEFIPGYQPFDQDRKDRRMQIRAASKRCEDEEDEEEDAAEDDDDETGSPPPHSSHEHFATAEEYLRITVDIAPSCATCKVRFETEPKEKTTTSMMEHHQNHRAAKRRRFENEGLEHNSNNEEQEEDQYPEEEEDNSRTNPKTGQDTKPTTSKDSKLQPPKMPLSQVLDQLRPMLPDIVDKKDVSSQFLMEPLGVVLHEYSRPRQGGGVEDTIDQVSSFCVSLAQGGGENSETSTKTPGLAEYHHSIQRLALGWIEAADGIDVNYQPHGFGQYWQILYLFQKHAPDKYSLAGYITLWTVTSLLAKPRSGKILRITQAFILPHHQRQGHGHELMRVIYRLAQGTYDERLPPPKLPTTNPAETLVVEPYIQVNVEDPASGFVALRDLVDYTMFLEHPEWAKALLVPKEEEEVVHNSDTASKQQSLIKELAVLAKITPRQVQIVQELFRFRALHQKQQQTEKPVLVAAAAAATNNEQQQEDEDDIEKSFRLAVKERLYQENKLSITALSSKDKMRQELHKLYEGQKEHYHRILEKCHTATWNGC